MKYTVLGKTGMEISAVAYGGIVSSGFYEGESFPEDDQNASDRYVSWAIDRGVNYFDVAPKYGDAQQQLGHSLKPYRSRVNLACKTGKRSRAEAEPELYDSLRKLQTDAFEIYQLHEIKSLEDVEQAFAPGGVMELMDEVKRKGIAAHIGFTAHDEDAALRMIELYDFESILFPFNWFMHMEHGMGSRILKAARERGMGVLCMKSLIERSWENDAERVASKFPKSWCKPIDVEDEAFGTAAMKYALSLGVDTLIPPGNFASFSFAVEHIEECLEHPLTADDEAFLREKLDKVRGKEFF